MTPLVAGIALTGKAPVYEKVYMSGLKQKAAGEAAAAKAKNKQLEDIRAAITIPKGGVHNSLVGEVKDVAAETLFNVTKVIEADPVRGINKAWDMVLDFESKMNVYQNTSKVLNKIETPEYNKNYFSSPQFVQGIGTMNFKDVEADPEIVENARKAGINIQRINGLPVMSTQDFPRFDPSEPFIDWQKATVAKNKAELGDITNLGANIRQEILKRVPEEEAIAYLEGKSKEPSEVAAWWNKHNIDITNPEGRKAAAERFLYTQEKTQSYTRPTGRANRAGLQETFEVLDGVNSPKIDVNFGGTKTMSSEKAIPFPQVNVSVNYRGAFKIGEQLNYSKLSGDISRETDNFQVKDIRSVKSWTGKRIEIPKGDYDGINFNSNVVLEQGMPLPDDVRNVLPKYIDRLKEDALQTIFGSTDRAALKAKIVNRDWIVGSGLNQEGKAKSETIFVPATKENLLQLEKSSSLSSNKYYKIRQHLKKAVEDPTILYKLNILGAATKGAETQPKSGFSLLEFDTFA